MTYDRRISSRLAGHRSISFYLIFAHQMAARPQSALLRLLRLNDLKFSLHLPSLSRNLPTLAKGSGRCGNRDQVGLWNRALPGLKTRAQVTDLDPSLLNVPVDPWWEMMTILSKAEQQLSGSKRRREKMGKGGLAHLHQRRVSSFDP